LFSLLYKITLITVSCSRFFAPLIYHSYKYNLFYFRLLLNCSIPIVHAPQKVRTRIACQNKISHKFGLANRGSSGLLPNFLRSTIARDRILAWVPPISPPGMERRGLLKAALFLCLLAVCSGRELTIKHNPSTAIYNSTLAKILVEYAAAIYTADLTQLFNWTCARCGDLIKGFKMIQIVVDVENCLEVVPYFFCTFIFMSYSILIMFQ